MPRMRFSKTGNAVWISHLDLMRALQRGFRRAGVLLKHSQGFTPHPVLSIALPLSVGVSSDYEIADFELDAPTDLAALPARLNAALPKGIEILECYEDGEKLKHLKWLEARLTLIYDAGVPVQAADQIRTLFARPSLEVEKHGKNGPVTVDILPMLHAYSVTQPDETTLALTATVSAQNPTLNPLLLLTAIEAELPACKPDFTRCHRIQIMNEAFHAFR